MADISELVLRVDSDGVVSATRRLNNLGRSAKENEKTLTSVIKTLGKMGVAIGTVIASLKGVTKYVKESVKAFAGYESVKTNLQIVTGSAKEAERQFRSLKELAAATPFEIEGLTNASIALQQVGVKASEVEQTIRMLGDASGGNNELFNRISQNYAQILSVGKASSMDIKQFAQMGLPVYQLIKDMGIQGTVTADQVTEMFRRMTSEGGTFFNGMALQSNTLNGKMSTLSDTWKGFLATFAETSGLAESTKKVIDGLTETIQSLQDKLEIDKQKTKETKGYLAGDAIDSYNYLIETVETYGNLLKKNNGYTDEMLENLAKLEVGFAGESLNQLEETYRQARIELEAVQESYDIAQKRIEQEQKLLAIEEERAKVNEEMNALMLADAGTYDELIVGINEEYKRVTSTEESRLRDKIAFYNELLGKTKHIHKEINTGEGFKPITEDYDIAMFNADEQEKIKAVIEDATEELKNLNENIASPDWLDKFKEVTGVDISEFRGTKGSGKNAGRKYNRNLWGNVERNKGIANALNGSYDLVSILQEQTAKAESDIRALIESGEFSLDDNSIQEMISEYKKLKDFAEEVSEKQEKITKMQAQESYIQNLPKEKARQFVQGTDVGNFVEGMEQGGIWGAVLNTLLSALSNVVGGIEGMNLVMSPVTELLKEFEPTIKSLMIPTMYIARGLVLVARGIQWLLNIFTFGLVDRLADEWDRMVEESKENTSALKNSTQAINGVTNSLRQLQEEIDKQQKYYKEEKLSLQAQNRYNVNDMILTPRGVFSTHPKDTIIATKNPQDLVSGGKINVVINNTQSNNVNVSARQDGYGKLIIDISRKVASDYASGSNGWDGAVGYREQKKRGRNLS